MAFEQISFQRKRKKHSGLIIKIRDFCFSLCCTEHHGLWDQTLLYLGMLTVRWESFLQVL